MPRKPARPSLRTLADLGRVSNLPTVLTNVLVGGAAALADPPLRPLLGAMLAASLLYYAGMALNDAVDAPVDAARRARRPIVRGRITRRTAFAIAFGGLILGGAVAFALHPTAGLTALVLIGAIAAYDFFHGRFAGAIVLMGVCRALVYPLGAAALTGDTGLPAMLWPMAAVLLYTVGLTLIARAEHGRGGSRWAKAAWALPFVPLIGAAGIGIDNQGLGTFAAGCLVAWGVYAALLVNRARPKTKRAVQAWIAGFCLIDAVYLALLDQVSLMLLAFGLFGLTLALHRVVKGT